MLTNSSIRDVLNAHMEKESIVLERGDSAVEFWHTLFNYSMCKHYNPVTKTWQDDRQDDDSPEYKEWVSRLAIYRDLQDLAIDFAACDDLSLVNKQGKLLKRFAKYIKKTINAELDSRMAGIIGDKIQSFLTNARCEFTFDFANVIDWDDGYFGHSGSCWWDEYSESRATFDNAGGYSIRFYRDEFDRRGIGRTWVLPYNGALVCFNSYGVDRPKVIQVLKQVFKQHGITLEHKCLEVNNDEDNTIPYINGGTGFVLAESGHEYLTETSVYVSMPVVHEGYYQGYGNEGGYVCDSCGDRVDEEYVRTTDYGDTYCDDCWNERFFYCEKCGYDCDRDDEVRIHGHHRYDYVCRDCARNLDAAQCENCDEYHCDYIVTEDSNSTYCQECAESREVYHCEECSCDYEYTAGCESCMTGEFAEVETDGTEEETTDETQGETSVDFPSVSVNPDSTVTFWYGGTPNEYTVTTITLDCADGLFALHAKQIDQDNSGYYVVHAQSGLAASAPLPDRRTALLYMEKIGGLIDWTQPKDVVLEKLPLIRDDVFKIREELEMK